MTPRKFALVTGATRGIGRAIAEKLAEEGYGLLLVARSETDLQKQKSILEETYETMVDTYPVDLSNPDKIQGLLEWAKTFAPDVLVNNVGIFIPVPLLEEQPEDFLPQFYLNYFVAHQLCVQLGKGMRDRKQGHIFNITSTASRDPVTAGTYTVTKFALRGLTSVLREELRPWGVKVTEIIPGSTNTSSWDGAGYSDNRFVVPLDIAETVIMCLKSAPATMVEEILIKPQQGNIIG